MHACIYVHAQLHILIYNIRSPSIIYIHIYNCKIKMKNVKHIYHRSVKVENIIFHTLCVMLFCQKTNQKNEDRYINYCCNRFVFTICH